MISLRDAFEAINSKNDISLESGSDESLARLIITLAIKDVTVFTDSYYQEIFLPLVLQGGLNDVEPELCQEIQDALLNIDLGQSKFRVSSKSLFALGFANMSSFEWRQAVFKGLVARLIVICHETENYKTALQLEHTCFGVLKSGRENTGFFSTFFEQVQSDIESSAVKFSTQNFSIEAPPPRSAEKIAFVFLREGMGPMVEVICDLADSILRFGPKELEVFVVSLEGEDEKFRQMSERSGAALFAAMAGANSGSDFAGAIRSTKTFLAEQGVGVVVWPDSPIGMLFAFGARLAPVQLWLAAKYHDLQSDHIDGYLCGVSFEKFSSIDGRLWRNQPPCFRQTTLTDPSKKADGAQLRASLLHSFDVILMNIGRSEKIEHPSYLSAVIRILKANKNCCFLYAGSQKSSELKKAAISNGVESQCIFIGWVEPLVFMHVHDIYLDSFPSPSGVTGFQAVASGKPVVFYETSEARGRGVGPYISEALNSDDEQLVGAMHEIFDDHELGADGLFMNALTEDQYVEHANQLISDIRLRERAGLANSRFTEEYLFKADRWAARFLEHVDDIAQEKNSFNSE